MTCRLCSCGGELRPARKGRGCCAPKRSSALPCPIPGPESPKLDVAWVRPHAVLENRTTGPASGQRQVRDPAAPRALHLTPPDHAIVSGTRTRNCGACGAAAGPRRGSHLRLPHSRSFSVSLPLSLEMAESALAREVESCSAFFQEAKDVNLSRSTQATRVQTGDNQTHRQRGEGAERPVRCTAS